MTRWHYDQTSIPFVGRVGLGVEIAKTVFVDIVDVPMYNPTLATLANLLPLSD